MNIKYNHAIKSICPSDGKHIILWDFDGVKLDKIRRSLKKIQDQYMLSNIYVMSTRNGYNAFCLDKHCLDFVYEIKCNTAYDDYYHQVNGYDLGGWCLRIGSDKKLVEVLKSTVYNIGSFAHKEFFRMILSIDCEGVFDDSNLLCINYYKKR